MTTRIDRHTTQLSFAIYENPGVYALLIGSGVSRAAHIPTGWEITLDLIRRIAQLHGNQDHHDLVLWYKQTFDSEPNYSDLVQNLGESPEERRSILKAYIEPTQAHLQSGHRIPTDAHYAIADLVAAGYVRVIVTTNFDRLIENALIERGIDPTVVASPDALKGAEPLTHTKCYLFKLHGDYQDSRIRNTDTELSDYPPQYKALLERIFDEYGLIVCGWSGEWDHALREAIMRTRARRWRYSMFWAARTAPDPDSVTARLIQHRRGSVIPIADANGFFSIVREYVQTLADTHRPNPDSIELLVTTTKQYLSKPDQQIRLEELLNSVAQSLLDNLQDADFSMQPSWNADEFRRRIAIYEASAEPLARMMGVLARWGNHDHYSLIIHTARSIHARLNPRQGGTTIWITLHHYPVVLLLAACGIALARSERWADLCHLLLMPFETSSDTEPQTVSKSLSLWFWEGIRGDPWQALEDQTDSITPLSNHLCELLNVWGESYIGLVPDFEELYATWEIIASLAYVNSLDFKEFENELKSNDGRGFVRMPVGRSGLDPRVRDRVLARLREQLATSLLEAGLSDGFPPHFQLAIQNFCRIGSRLRMQSLLK